MNLTEFDAANYLKSDADIADYMTAVLAENDPALFMAALNDIARAKGITSLARTSGLNRESLYKALKPGAKPRFDTVFRIMAGMNIRLQAVAE